MKNKEYLYDELPEKVKDDVLLEASFITATPGDDLIESDERAKKWIKENDYPKTITHWQTMP